MDRVLVWDIPVRLYHWLLVAGFAAAFAIAEGADDDGAFFVVHMVIGLGVGLLTILRIIWGLIGSRYARFSGFAFRPQALIAYFRSLFAPAGAVAPGHNPATSYAAVGMFAACLGLAASGLALALGGGDGAEGLHEFCGAAMLGLGAVHVAGVVIHTLRYRDGIALSMLDGRKQVPADSAIASKQMVPGLVGLGVLAITLGWLFAGYDPATGRVTPPGTALTLAGEGDKVGESDEADDKGEDGARRKDDHEDGEREHGKPKHRERVDDDGRRSHRGHTHGEHQPGGD